MARFATAPVPAPTARTSIGPNPTVTRSFEGGRAYIASDVHIELFSAAVNGFLADNFYESADARIKRLISLVPQCDPEWLQEFIPWLRSGANMRSAPVVLAVEYARAKFPNSRQVVSKSLQRADEPAEVLGYWMSRYARQKPHQGVEMPASLKRGLADAVTRLYTQRAMLRYDGTNAVRNPWRFGDVIEMVHPKPADATQTALFKFCLDRRRHEPEIDPAVLRLVFNTLAMEKAPKELRTTERMAAALNDDAVVFSWERAAGWLEHTLTKADWEALLPSMGYFAVLRNLNNFERARVSPQLVGEILTDPEKVKWSRVMPFRFLTAYKHMETDTYKVPLASAADMALVNLPEFSGKTLIMVDASGSMEKPAAGKQSKLARSEVAGFFAEALARRCERVEVWTYSTDSRYHGGNAIATRVEIVPHASVLRGASRDAYAPTYGTYTWTSTERVFAAMTAKPDRVVIITDEESGDSDTGSVNVPVITWNVAGYKEHHAAHDGRKRLFVAGVNDQVMQTLPAVIAHGSTGQWPWEITPTVEGGAEDD